MFLFSLQQIQNCIIWTEANRIFDRNGSKHVMSQLHLRDESDSKFQILEVKFHWEIQGVGGYDE